jgi:hypothetical protein
VGIEVEGIILEMPISLIKSEFVNCWYIRQHGGVGLQMLIVRIRTIGLELM